MKDLEMAFSGGRGLRADTTPMEDTDGHVPNKIVCVCYSKGMPDLLTFLQANPQHLGNVRAVFSWAGAIGGSVLADEMLQNLKSAERSRSRLKKSILEWTGAQSSIMNVPMPLIKWATQDHGAENGTAGSADLADNYRFKEWDVVGAIESLSTPVRTAFLAEHKEEIEAWPFPLFNFTGATTADEVPFFQTSGYMKLAAYDVDNDMQLTQQDARLGFSNEIPLAVFRGHHWDVSYPQFPTHMTLGSSCLQHPFPKYPAVLAMVLLCGEMGLLD